MPVFSKDNTIKELKYEADDLVVFSGLILKKI